MLLLLIEFSDKNEDAKREKRWQCSRFHILSFNLELCNANKGYPTFCQLLGSKM